MNREIQRLRREQPVAEANREYRLHCDYLLDIEDLGDAETQYDDFVEDTRRKLSRLLSSSPVRPYYTALVRKLEEGRPSFLAQLHRRIANVAKERVKNIPRKNVNWSKAGTDPISLATAANWPGNRAVGITYGGKTNYYTPQSFFGHFGQTWMFINGNRLAQTNPMTRQPVTMGNLSFVRFTGNRRASNSPRKSPNKLLSPK